MSKNAATTSSAPGEISQTIDAGGRFFLVLWDKSPFLAGFVVVMAVLLPFYWISLYTWSGIRKAENAANSKAGGARQASKRTASKARKEPTNA